MQAMQQLLESQTPEVMHAERHEQAAYALA